jgi:hypothetical protein
MCLLLNREPNRHYHEKNNAHENSVVLVDVHLSSMALKTGVGTAYSATKFPWVSLTLRVLPRLIVCRLLHALSMPFVEVETTEPGRLSA